MTKATVMTDHRRISLTAGTVFIVATAASLTATKLLPALTGDDLSRVVGQSGAMATAFLLNLVAAGCSLGIAIALYAVLHRSHPTMALGAVVFRAIEAVCYIVGAVSLITVLTVASPAHPVGDRATAQAMSDALVSAHDRASIAGVGAFVVGGLLYYVALYRTRLVPRWLSGWGIIALPVMAIACGLALYRDQPVTGFVALAAPIGVQEIVFGIWLLIKGFTPAQPRQPAPAEALDISTG